MNYRFALSRRTLLKASGITLGLPFLDAMTRRSVYGAEPDPGAAMVSLMYGLGSPYFVLDRGFEGPLRYYQTLVNNGQLSLYTDVNMAAAAEFPVDAQHHHGQPYLFSGYRTQLTEGNNVIPQGPSLHFETFAANYPTETPTPYRIIDCGIYFRRGLNYQIQRIYDREGRNAADFEDVASPVELFEKLFGTVPQADAMTAKERAARSIMDYLRPAYEKYTGGSSNLPAGDIAVLNNHLERIRQIERNVYAAQDRPVVEVTRPSEPGLDYKVDGGNDSEPDRVYRVNPVDFEVAYQLLGDIFVAGLEADMFRFGNLSFDSGGGHTHFEGAYPTPDDANYAFNGNPHYDYHRLASDDPAAIAVGTAHNHFIHKNIAQILEKMDSREFPGANGKTLLENVAVMIGSEVGTNHDVSRVFHGFAGGAGRFALGKHVTTTTKAIELYNALGHAYGLESVGDGRDYQSDEQSLLA
jgi:hypothetical protein